MIFCDLFLPAACMSGGDQCRDIGWETTPDIPPPISAWQHWPVGLCGNTSINVITNTLIWCAKDGESGDNYHSRQKWNESPICVRWLSFTASHKCPGGFLTKSLGECLARVVRGTDIIGQCGCAENPLPICRSCKQKLKQDERSLHKGKGNTSLNAWVRPRLQVSLWC